MELDKTELDLAALARMAKDDPVGFENTKQQLTRSLIRRAKSSSQGALIELQQKLNAFAKQTPKPYIGILMLTTHLESDLNKLDWQITDLRGRYCSKNIAG